MTLQELNGLDQAALRKVLQDSCGSRVWVEKMMTVFPVATRETLLDEAHRVWHACGKRDWLEAFVQHPRIGDLESLKKKYAGTGASMEQAGALEASLLILEALAEGNHVYEERFGYIFIVCATGKTAEEMLRLLRERIDHDPDKEIYVAMEEQEKITRLRLEKLLS